MADISINTKINVFRQNIADVISSSQLPVGVLYYVFKDVINEIEVLYDDILKKEIQDIQKEQEDIKENQE